MIKCKQAMESSTCGKDCCCLECEEKETCKDVCSDLSTDCADAVTEETALATMKQEAAVAGGLAGIYYGCGGENGVPDEWIAQIPRCDWIKALCDELIIEN